MEEFGKNEIDGERWKDFVDGSAFPIKPLYKKEMTIYPHATLESNSNGDPNFLDPDGGILRRGIYEGYLSKFVDYKEEVDEKRHVYLGNKTYMSLCQDSEYALALFHILLPYAVQYCKKGLTLPRSMNDAFKRCIENYDDFKETFDEHYEITNDLGDMIWKKDVFKIFEKKDRNGEPSGYLFGMDETKIKRKMKAYGVTYDSQKEKYNPKRKGFYLKLKFRTVSAFNM